MKIIRWILILLLLSPQAFSQKATDQDMVESALHAYFRSSNPENISASRSQVKERVQEIINVPNNDDSNVYITIIFNGGLTADEVGDFANLSSLEIAATQSKTAVGTEGEVYTMGVGAKQLLMHPVGDAEKLKITTGSQQLYLLNLYEVTEGKVAENLMEVISNPAIKYYVVEALTQIKQLRELLEDTRVLEIIPDFDGGKLASFREEKQVAERNSTNMVIHEPGVPLGEGVPDGIPRGLVRHVKPLPSQRVIEKLQGGIGND